MTGAFLTAHWRHLAMLNYEVNPLVLEPHLPKGTELDSFGGRHFISLVGFRFLDTRLLGIPAFFHRDFEEVNLRFYVRRKVGKESRAGVVFIREMVPLPLVAEMAKLTYNEPYRTVPMRHSLVEKDGRLQRVEYWFGAAPDECRLAMNLDGAPQEMREGSQEEFLSHRGWGYTRQRDGGTIEYRVEHPRWRIWPTRNWSLAGPMGEFYDEPFRTILTEDSETPPSALVADGSAVTVYFPERIALEPATTRTMTTTAQETDLRYPIGKFDWDAPISESDYPKLIDAIAETPAALRSAVAGLSRDQLETPYRPGGWTVKQVAHHVPDSHLNAYTRFKLALTEDEPTIKPYDEAAWAELADSQKVPIDVSLSLLDALHVRWVAVLRSMDAADFGRTLRHPEHGRVLTLAQMLGLYAWHGRHHVSHITALRKREGW